MAKTSSVRSSDSVIGSSAVVKGRVRGDGNLRVEGKVEGEIAIEGDLTIAEEGVVTSQVDAADVTIAGTLDGDVSAKGVVRIQRGAKVRGDIRGETFSLDEGAEFAGRLDADFDLPPELNTSSAPKRR
ncbi:MAG: polymer-forming cytoskeletal protein [Polyangiaceae bacterium]|jgi:cytoskeletal protein CcmA (bactofilin family)|nr:polymer-forming cytoskeletal protein [Polyangiaceae bacterium]